MVAVSFFWYTSVVALMSSENALHVLIMSVIVDEGTGRNPLYRHFENTKKRPLTHAATLLIIYHRIQREKRSQSEDGIRDRMLVYLY